MKFYTAEMIWLAKHSIKQVTVPKGFNTCGEEECLVLGCGNGKDLAYKVQISLKIKEVIKKPTAVVAEMFLLLPELKTVCGRSAADKLLVAIKKYIAAE